MKLLLLLLLIPAQANADCSVFNGKLLFENPIAFVRSPSNGIEIQTSRYLGDRVYLIEASMGAESPLFTCLNNNAAVQLGLEAGMWVTLGYNDGAFPLLTQDFTFSLPLAFKWKNITAIIKWNHISAHLGDGMDVMLEDNLTARERKEYEYYKEIANLVDVDLTLADAFNYSRDFISGHVDIRNQVGIWGTRLYAHGGYAYKITPDLRRWYMGSGLEVWYPGELIRPYFAQDVTYNADVDSVDLSVEIGISILPNSNSYFHPRLALTGYIGSDRKGQLLGRRLKQVGFGIYF